VPARSAYPGTWNGIALALLDTLTDLEFMARCHNPDGPRTDGELRVLRDAEKRVTEQRAMMWRAIDGPNRDAAYGDTDAFLRYISQPWAELTEGHGGTFWKKQRKVNRDLLGEWDAGGYGEKAALLRRDLGEQFFAASLDEQATMVRRWVHRYQRQGRLPSGKPPVSQP
jgi:hypothetical protein